MKIETKGARRALPGHILWYDPGRNLYTRQVGRAHAADIAQAGRNA